MLSRAQFLQLTRDLNRPDIEAWRTARVLSDERGHLSLRGFLALFNEKQLVHELMRVYDLDQDGLLEPAPASALRRMAASDHVGVTRVFAKFGGFDADPALLARRLTELVPKDEL